MRRLIRQRSRTTTSRKPDQIITGRTPVRTFSRRLRRRLGRIAGPHQDRSATVTPPRNVMLNNTPAQLVRIAIHDAAQQLRRRCRHARRASCQRVPNPGPARPQTVRTQQAITARLRINPQRRGIQRCRLKETDAATLLEDHESVRAGLDNDRSHHVAVSSISAARMAATTHTSSDNAAASSRSTHKACARSLSAASLRTRPNDSGLEPSQLATVLGIVCLLVGCRAVDRVPCAGAFRDLVLERAMRASQIKTKRRAATRCCA